MTIQAKEVPIAKCVANSDPNPICGSTKSKSGTIIKPPPMPNKPAIKPASKPVNGKIIHRGKISKSVLSKKVLSETEMSKRELNNLG